MTVYLVGAGPGDPELLTRRGAALLAQADVVVHDRLADGSLLELAPPGALRIDVGKVPGGPVDQEAINRLLIDHSRAGARVVRLKGGDPFVFGRGGEEAAALLAAGVEFEVVPGVTAAVAAPAYAGVPVTHRGLSTSFTVVTGHSRHAVDTETDWDALARVCGAGGTVVVLMGVAHRDAITSRLIAGGLDPSTPVAAVTWGTRPDQRTVRTSLGALGAVSLEPPATIVIGAVAGLELGWFERRPLFGRTVVVTRAREQASALVALLRAAGAATLEIPAIAFEPPADGGQALAAAARALSAGEYQWVVFTSANAVERFVPLLRDSRGFGGASVAAIGPGTAAALASWHVVADLVPPSYVAESLLSVFPAGPAGPGFGRVLLPRAEVARPVLPEGLRAAGWSVDVVPAYRTVPVAVPPSVAAAARAADAITFASSGTVTAYLSAAGADALPARPGLVACIGPVTAATARDAGLRVDVEAAEHTLGGLVAALVAALGRA